MLHFDGTGPQATAVAFSFPELPPGPAIVAVRGTCSGGNVHVQVSAPVGQYDIDLTGGSELVRTQLLLASPGHEITYEVLQDVGQTVEYSFDLFVGLPSDISFE